jgi:hypothetical protein
VHHNNNRPVQPVNAGSDSKIIKSAEAVAITESWNFFFDTVIFLLKNI